MTNRWKKSRTCSNPKCKHIHYSSIQAKSNGAGEYFCTWCETPLKKADKTKK